MGVLITHICAVSQGGVSDYADICSQRQPGAIMLALNKEMAASMSLSGDVILHYVGYGYTKRGAPLWLLKKLEAERSNIKTLGVYFHELYAFGAPWSSAFWFSPIQRHIARRIVELSDFWITNRNESALWLKRFASNKPHAVLPVFSNVGEMPLYLAKRLSRIVVFGGSALREETYRAAGDKLFSWAHTSGLEIHDIGPLIKDKAINDGLVKAGAIIHGYMDTKAISMFLSNALFGVVKYPVEYVAKSGVFAAYAAHGVCPVLISDNEVISDGLVAGKHYLYDIPSGNVNKTIIQSIGKSVWDWYQSHSVDSHISVQLSLLRSK